jgi:gamma-glutamyltranspeptidase/glutathione hydrolase
MVLRTQLWGQNPQAASDAPRWRVTGGRGVALETGFAPAVRDGLRALGHAVAVEPPDAAFAFGGAQLIARLPDGYVAGSDGRKDGCALGF